MKDEKGREKGKYTETFVKNIEGIQYTKTEMTVIGRDSEILNFSRDYNPPMKFGTETGDWVNTSSYDGEIKNITKEEVNHLRTVIFEE